MREKIMLIIFVCVLIAVSIGYGLYHKYQHYNLRNKLESVNAGELQQQLESITAELEHVRAVLIESERSVERLEDVDRRRLEGIGRIYGIIDHAGEAVIGIASGDQRARIAFGAISSIIDILEAEFR